MKLLKRLLALPLTSLALIAGCASSPDVVDSQPVARGQAAVAQIDSNLARLRDLSVLRVGHLVEHAPASALQCYNLPCNDDDRRVVEAARVVAAERLAEFTHRVAKLEPASGTSVEAAVCAPGTIDANLERLSGLGIIEVEGLVRIEPATSPECYNLVCPSDQQRADQATCDNAATLASIVAATGDMAK
jgi:hypothetical protein